MSGQQYTIRRKVLTLMGAKFHVYDSNGELIGFSKQKAFKLKEDIRVYTDESLQDERVCIKARSVVDFSAAYDVIDSVNQTKIGAFKRKGMKSILKDEWMVLDESDHEIGKITEDSTAMALVRRFVLNIIPQTFHFRDSSGQDYAEFRTHFNPFVHRMTVTVDEDCPLNPLMMLAGGILLVAIEGRQG